MAGQYENTERGEVTMKTIRSASTAGLALLIAACSSGTEPGTNPTVSLSFATRAGTGPATAVPFGFSASMSSFLDDTLTSGSDTLIITKAQIVLREIELERVEVVDCDIEPEPEGCEDFEVGPIVIDLPLNPGTQALVSIAIPVGSYDELEFDIHKVSSSEAIATSNPELVDQSIRVVGTFNGQPFVFLSDLNVEQEFDLIPPMVIDETTTSTNITVRVGLSSWFRSATGALLDPGNVDNESTIENNIQTSIEAFEDQDSDGDDTDES